MKKILFIEDESTLQKALSKALEMEGYEVINAQDGESGFNLIMSERPDLILLDIVLPKMSGLEILKKIKEDQSMKKTSVIILSNLEGTAEIGKAMELGAAAYLIKSNYGLEEIVTKIKKFLNVEQNES